MSLSIIELDTELYIQMSTYFFQSLKGNCDNVFSFNCFNLNLLNKI